MKAVWCLTLANPGSSHRWGKLLQIKSVWCSRAGGSDKMGLRPDAPTIHGAGHRKHFSAIGFLSWRAKLVGWVLRTPSHAKILHHMVRCCHVVGLTLLSTTLCAHRLFYSFNASDGSGGFAAGRVVSLRPVMMHLDFRSKEVRRTRKQNIDYAMQHHTPHCWLPNKL